MLRKLLTSKQLPSQLQPAQTRRRRSPSTRSRSSETALRSQSRPRSLRLSLCRPRLNAAPARSPPTGTPRLSSKMSLTQLLSAAKSLPHLRLDGRLAALSMIGHAPRAPTSVRASRWRVPARSGHVALQLRSLPDRLLMSAPSVWWQHYEDRSCPDSSPTRHR